MLPAVLVSAALFAQGGPIPGNTVLGTACGGVGGPATIELTSALRAGYPGILQFGNLPPASVAAMLLGWSGSTWGGVPLPLSLASAGMPGCRLWLAPEASFPFATGSGSMQCGFGVSTSPAIVGLDLHMQTIFAQPGLNAAGFGLTPALRAHIAPLPAATSWVTSIAQFGITYQFASPVRAGQFVNGDWFVVGPATLTGMLPACTTANGRVLHGAMVDPDPSVRDHGYDGELYGPGNSALYHPALNVAAGLTAATPLLLQQNHSLVKVISNTDPTLLPQIRTCSVLTIVPDVPPAESFRPPYAGTDHAVRYDATMLDWSALRALQPASGQPHIATEAAKFERPWLDHCPGWTSRYMHPIENMPDYSRDFTSDYAQAALLCNLGVTQAERRLLLIRLVQIGIDFWGNVENGCHWEGTGGQGSGRKLPILFAGALLHDAEMLAVGVNYPSYRNANGTSVAHFGEDCQTFHVAQTSSTQINWGFGGYGPEDLGLPEWGFSHVDWPSNDREPWNADSYRRCCTANAWIGEVLCARVMGLRDAWHHPPLFDYMDRYTQTEPHGWTYAWSTWCGAMWDMHRASN
jgi:hypothetical protein